jgi:pimeloyl-ACP methyl ester carboxylesterase
MRTLTGRLRALLLAVPAAVALAAAAVWFVFPELLVQAANSQARRAAGLERRSLDVAGHHIVYLDGGSGTPVVLLHGFGASKDLWNTVAAQLTPHYRVIALDLPGFGESPVVDGATYDAPSQAQRLHALLGALGVREHHIGGNSMGGVIATIYAASYPRNVRSLLINDAPGVRTPVVSELQRLLAAGENPFLVRDQADVDRLLDLVLYRPPSFPAPIRSAMGRDAIGRRAGYARIWNDYGIDRPGAEDMLGPLLPGISAPTLVLWGEVDDLVDVSAADVFARLLPNAHKVVLANCGHSPAWECPGPMAQSYRAFLDAVSAEGAGDDA